MPNLRFGLYYDFRNPPKWRRDPTTLYNAILAQIARAEALGFNDVWLSEHHFVEDGYTPSCLPLAGWEEYSRRLGADTDLPGRGVLVVSPAQATDIIRKYVDEMRVNRWYSWTLPPGLPPEWADEHIELMAQEVIPAFR